MYIRAKSEPEKMNRFFIFKKTACVFNDLKLNKLLKLNLKGAAIIANISETAVTTGGHYGLSHIVTVHYDSP